MNWVAIVPLKPPGERKSRLAARFSAAKRDALSDALMNHVVQRLALEPRVSSIVQLSKIRSDGPFQWRRDEGRGLNSELDAIRAEEHAHGLLVIHADLPLVGADDIAIMLDAAERSGLAIAPDRHGLGTNAIALAPATAFAFAFGEDSFRRHVHQARGKAEIVTRPGLALDLDTSEDFDLALETGASDLLRRAVLL